MELQLLMVLVVVNILLAIFIAFFRAYLQCQVKNIATKEDIRIIAEKIESIKNDHSKSLEDYKTGLINQYESSRAEISMVAKLDQELIDLSVKINDTIYKFTQLNDLSRAGNISDDLFLLTQHLVKYKVRYGHLQAAKDIVDINNNIEQIKKKFKTDDDPERLQELSDLYNRLDIALQKMLSLFIAKAKA